MTEATRKEAEEVARREVSDFSIRVLGYDRENPGNDQKPEETLAWARRKQLREVKAIKWLGSAVLALAAAVGTAILTKITPIIVKLLGL